MQKRFTTHRAAVESYPLGYQKVGILKPGRYNGFDVMTSTGGLGISIGHSGQIPKTNIEGDAENAFGALLMPTGIIIHQHDALLLSVPTNQSYETARVHLVICEHNYSAVQGGVPATYSIVEGNHPINIPSIPNPTKQVAIGTIKVEANGNTYEDMTYTPILGPLLGDLDPAGLYAYLQTLVNQAVEDANTPAVVGAVNLGSGIKIFKDKVNNILRFKTIKSSDNSIQVVTSVVDEEEGIEEIDLKAIPGANIISTSDSVLLGPTHNGKVIRFTNGASPVTITIPEGLPSNFHVGFTKDDSTAPGSNGIIAYGTDSAPNITVVTTGAVKARTSDGIKLAGKGKMAMIQSTGITDYYMIMGDLVF